MKKVTGQFQIEYVLDQKSRQNTSDGEVYRVEGKDGLSVKILKNPTKAMQMELENVMMGNISADFYDMPQDIAYSRGKFVGYVFQAMNVSPEPVTDPIPEPGPVLEPEIIHNQKTESVFDNMAFKIGITALVGVILGILNIKVFFGQYLTFVGAKFSEGVLNGCQLFGFSGITSLIGGIIAMVGLGKLIKNANGVVFILLEAVAFFVGIIAVDFLLALIIAVVLGAVSLLLAILPTVIFIVVIVVVLKNLLKSIF